MRQFMSKHILKGFLFLLLLPMLAVLAFGTVESWSTYHKIDRHTARINGCPYWNDILRNCFPETLEDKTLDRIGLKDIPKSIPDAYYDPAGQMPCTAPGALLPVRTTPPKDTARDLMIEISDTP